MDEPSISRSDKLRERLGQVRTSVRRVWPKIWPFIAGVLAAFLAVFLYNALFPPPLPLTNEEVNNTVAQAMASATAPPSYSSLVYQAIHPSLVLIQVQDPQADGKVEQALGSGVVINDNGDILTSLHVVNNASEIQLTFADGTESNAEVVNKQPESDIAVIRALTPPAQIVPATLGNPNAMHIGDEAFVVGNPFGLYSSMSSGVISGFNRSFEPPGGKQKIQHLIQIDAAVNPGNSGGPLLNRNGEVIGIVTGIVNPTGQDVFIGIGFAVPINIAGGALGSPPD